MTKEETLKQKKVLRNLLDASFDKHFKIYRITHEPVFDCLVYVQGQCVAGCSMVNWPKTFYRWRLVRLFKFLYYCRNYAHVELIQGVNSESEWLKGKRLKDFGLESKDVTFTEYWKDGKVSSETWQTGDAPEGVQGKLF